MKVIILCSNYEPGGAQRAALKLHTEFANHSIDSRPIFFHRKSINFTEGKPEIILDGKISSIKDLLYIFGQLFKLLKKEKPDAIITFLPYANIIGSIIARLVGIKVRVSSHRSESQDELNRINKSLDYLMAHLGFYTHITAVSESTKKSFNYYSRKIYAKVKVVNNGVSIKLPSESKGSCRKALNLPENSFIIGSVGRLVEQKNYTLLINILPKLGDVKLVIVGKGHLKSEIINLATKLNVLDKLLLIDELNATQIPYFLKAIDIFAMPTLLEGLSNALIEALSAGLPIVSNDVDSQRDVLTREDGFQAGYLISEKDHDQWVSVINELKNNPELRQSQSNKSIERAKDFTLERMYEGFLSQLS